MVTFYSCILLFNTIFQVDKPCAQKNTLLKAECWGNSAFSLGRWQTFAWRVRKEMCPYAWLPQKENKRWKWTRSVMSNSLWPPWTVAYQVPLSMGFSRQEYWSALSFPSPRKAAKPILFPTGGFLSICCEQTEWNISLCLSPFLLSNLINL